MTVWMSLQNEKEFDRVVQTIEERSEFFFSFFSLSRLRVNLVIFIIRFVCKKNRKNITTCNIID